MRLKHYFVLLAVGIVLLACIALIATFHDGGESIFSPPSQGGAGGGSAGGGYLFYVTEGFIVVLLFYLWHFYRKTIRPYDTLIGGIELVRALDLTTSLAPSGQHETDIIVRTFNDLLTRLRSEHLKLEEQYTFLNLLIEASPMGVIQCDLDGNTTTMNPAARKMLSPTVEETMRALPLGETTTMRLPGEPQLFRISHLSFPDRGYQHPFYLIESLTSEVRQAEKAAYERVIRMIAHEVNNSVAGIVTRERLTALAAFVTRFADVVKIPQPQLLLCDLSEEIEACRPFLENMCTQAHVSIDFHLTDEAIPVHLDTVLFQQALINIVKNAIEALSPAPASPPAPLSEGRRGSLRQGEKGVVTIEVIKHSTPFPHLGGAGGGSLIITDNGHGIPPNVAKHLFTPFFSTKPQGQGLGLLLIRDILTSHHCTFSLLTDPADRLTRFTIHFPS
ncbi:MAG: PAS domain-containing sensor histidine kinase [Prevotella sp.]|nr:PAS domain-containing sensor histidine kinase [Prevotella sp.]